MWRNPANIYWLHHLYLVFDTDTSWKHCQFLIALSLLTFRSVLPLYLTKTKRASLTVRCCFYKTVHRNPVRLLHRHGIPPPSLPPSPKTFHCFPSLCVQPFHPLILRLFLSSSIPRSLRCTGFIWSVFPYTRSQGAQGQLCQQEEETLALSAQHSCRVPQEGRKEGVRRPKV